jgi:outer membrane protein assembly factor BamE
LGLGRSGKANDIDYDMPPLTKTEFLKRSTSTMSKRATLAIFMWLGALVAAGCSGIAEYRIDIQQGNVVPREAVRQLKPGMTREQVRFLLGTPLLTDVFHDNRWDYVYRYENRRANTVDEHRLAVFFDKDGKLLRWQGDLPAGAPVTPPEQRNRVIDLGAAASPEKAPAQ